MLAVAALLLANTLMLYLIAGGVISAPGGPVPWIYVGIIVSGFARSFTMPSAFTLLSQIIPRKQMSEASAWFTGSFHFATVSAPAIAGLVYGAFGARKAWLLPVLLMLTALLMLPAASAHPRQYRNAGKREPAVQSIRAGWRFILENRTLLSVMALDMFAVLFGEWSPSCQLLPTRCCISAPMDSASCVPPARSGQASWRSSSPSDP